VKPGLLCCSLDRKACGFYAVASIEKLACFSVDKANLAFLDIDIVESLVDYDGVLDGTQI